MCYVASVQRHALCKLDTTSDDMCSACNFSRLNDKCNRLLPSLRLPYNVINY